VEVAGFEPASEDKTPRTSPYAVCFLKIRRRILEADMILRRLDKVFLFDELRLIVRVASLTKSTPFYNPSGEIVKGRVAN